MISVDLESALAAALTAKGSGPLPFRRMIELVEAGAPRGLTISTIDATCDNGWWPRGDWGFYAESEILEQMAGDPEGRAVAILKLAKATWDQMPPEPEIEFEVWFWSD
jgi:hypothetical protein